ncbi:MAG TPA: SDR family NAD(P)-dependent oxidoreductase, partial [Vicinamibacteria bacterium]|nr:SDR family NAD(P)-dependent oxidoreductase [Vicinamibacteria bacterium]
ARRAERLERLSAELGGEEAALPLALDLARPEAAERLAGELTSRGIAVDLLVNNAGLGAGGPLIEVPAARLQAVVDLDVRAVVTLTRAFVPAMVERGRGAVINVVSMSAFQPVPYLAVYAASKAFVLSLTEAMATELAGTGVSVQALCPGLVHTEFQEVAGTAEVPFNRTPPTSPAQVVAASLAALERGTLIVIPGLKDRIAVGAQRFVPRSWVRRIAGDLFRPPTRGGPAA